MTNDDDFTDGPADERCDSCGQLDPANCGCPPGPVIGDVDDFLEALADVYAGARDLHWREAYSLAESVTGIQFGPEALDAVDRTAFLTHLRELFA